MSGICDDSSYMEKILKNYGELKGELHLVELNREAANSGGVGPLGLSLAGNRDLATMSVFVVGIQPASVAAFSGLIHVGDELLEINGQTLYGRSHLNASAIIKAISSLHIKILLLRSEDFTERMAVSPLRLPPVIFKESLNTLIPKKQKTLSLDEGQGQDDSSTVCRASYKLQKKMQISESPVRNSDVPSSTVCAPAETTSKENADVVCSNRQDTCRHSLPTVNVHAPPVSDTLPALEKELTPEPISRPSASVSSQGKGRRLQKLAQVEETEGDVTSGGAAAATAAATATATATATAAAATAAAAAKGGAREPNGSSLTGSQLKHQEAKAVDIEITDTTVEWNRFQLEEISPETSTNSSSPLHPSGSAILEDPATCCIVSGRSNTIEVRKGRLGLGLKIIGGSDTILKAVIIYEIYKNGAAANDGRLWPGDQIIEVNGQDLREVTHSRAVQILRQVATTVRMVVFRDESLYRDDDMFDVTTVELMKKPGKGLGLSIISRRDNRGILISDIVKGGAADSDGRLLPGDQILAVNGDDMRTATQDYAAEQLKTSMGKIVLTIGRLKVSSKLNSSRNSSSSYSSRGIMKSESNTSDCKNAGRRTPKIGLMNCYTIVPCLRPQH